MKHNPVEKECRCSTCQAMRDEGISREEAIADFKRWEDDMMTKFGWFVHFIGGDPSTSTGLNMHTHGLEVTFEHPDLQIVAPISDKTAHNLMSTMVERIREGERFEDGQIVEHIVRDMPVKMVSAKDGDRPVLRMILPDPQGKVSLEEINEQWGAQYDDILGRSKKSKWTASKHKNK